jgi:pyruvate formate lyase activating enzyme
MTRFGVLQSVEDIMEELRPEFSLFKTSGGGVTFTGGEPTLYPEFTGRLAKTLHSEGIDVALETCGLFNLEKLRPLLQDLQLVLFDIKVFDEAKHRRLCGAGNIEIKNNLKSLVDDWNKRSGPFVWPRLPIVPGMTDGNDNIKGWAGFLRELGLSFLTIVPYHPMGVSKRKWLGLPSMSDIHVPSDAELKLIEQSFLDEGISIYKPGEENIKDHYNGN